MHNAQQMQLLCRVSNDLRYNNMSTSEEWHIIKLNFVLDIEIGRCWLDFGVFRTIHELMCCIFHHFRGSYISAYMGSNFIKLSVMLELEIISYWLRLSGFFSTSSSTACLKI